ncbi:MAG: amino acid adenylation domain-containing protein [Iphinoe sp. HA4291-MV1]|jgi:amino acid adenylation domain-containing protein|nr:amino acid adenylation domain-containing protein [Iphinoe sp. HA4291-MV1]
MTQYITEDSQTATENTLDTFQEDVFVFPASFAQARLWLLDQLEGETATYNISAALHLIGSLNVVALEMTVQEIVQRHEVLRTTFKMVNDSRHMPQRGKPAHGSGSPMQVIAPSLTMTLPVVDLQHLPQQEQSAVVQRLASEEAQRPFDLSNGPLLRVSLLRLEEQSHVLLLTMHHIVSDGWSMGVFIHELSALYKAFCGGEPSLRDATRTGLPELPIQYADFADWQREWLSGEVLQTQLDYWKQHLAGAPPLLELPTDRPRPSIQTFRGSNEYFQLNPEVTQKLKTLSQQSGVTLFMTLLAAFATLLSRYSGQEDIVIGSPIANRNRSEIESLIGFFTNTLVLRTQFQGNPTFSELLEQVREITLGAYAHQDLPFEKLVEELQPERSLSHSPLFQVMFILQNAPMGKLELPGLTITPLEVEEVTATDDLLLSMEETNAGLTGELLYNRDLFDATTIKRMIGHFQTLLEGIVANPQQSVAQLPMLSTAERHQLLFEYNDTKAEYPLEECFPQLFEAQVARTPDAVAVVFENSALTYQQLNARANRWARHLVELGVGAQTVVALLSDRNIDLLTAVLAVFKAGGAYLPLNPHHPVERIRQVFEQSQVPLVLSASEFEPIVTSALTNLEGTTPQLLYISQLEEQQHSSENLPVRSKPDNLAYVIYTSGSTGKPKGAMLEHRGMLNHLYAKAQDLHLNANDVVAQTAPASFDISVWQFLVALLVGGQVHIVRDEIAADPAQLLTVVEHQGISILEIVPSLLRMILQEIEANDSAKPELSALHWLLLTGEALPPQLCRQWLEYYPTIPMMNAYGPTECSDDVTHYPIFSPPSEEILNLPIGRAVLNTQLYVLDSQLQPVPIGVAGELYVGGVGVGRGYLNNPQQTQKAFLADPFTQQEGARLYKTGDKARYLPDGNIEFLGRIDYQVKIRGFRIELGEIEAILSQHPCVQEAVVNPCGDQSANKRLVAYVVPNSELTVTSSELRNFLKDKLPDYMVPSAFVTLEKMPLTPNGKVDRKALPAPDLELSLKDSFVAPRTLTEEILAKLWAEILNLKQVGIHDNFFELGGHSLLATQVISRLRSVFEVDLPLRRLFEFPTVADLAESIEKIRSTVQKLKASSSYDLEEREEIEL